MHYQMICSGVSHHNSLLCSFPQLASSFAMFAFAMFAIRQNPRIKRHTTHMNPTALTEIGSLPSIKSQYWNM